MERLTVLDASRDFFQGCGMWIRIHFFEDPDPDPAVLLNADPFPNPASFLMRIRIQLKKICNKLPYEAFYGVKKQKSLVKR